MTYTHIRKKHQFTVDSLVLTTQKMKQLGFFSRPDFWYTKGFSIHSKWSYVFNWDFQIFISETTKEGYVNIEWEAWNDEEKLYQTHVQQIMLVATECNYWWLRWWFLSDDGDCILTKYSKLFFDWYYFCPRKILGLKYRSKHTTLKRRWLDIIAGDYKCAIKELSGSIKYPNRNGYATKKQRKLEKLVRKVELTDKQVHQLDRSLNKAISSKRFVWFCQRRGIHNPFG